MSLYDWSTTPADNDDSDTLMNWAENHAPSLVNDNARQLMARVAAWRKDLAGSIVSAGTGNAYTLVANSTIGATYPDGLTICFTADRANGGSATLAVNGLAATPLRAKSGTALPANAIVPNQQYVARYRLSTNEFIITGTNAALIEAAPSLLSAQVFGLRVGDPIISFAPSPNPGFLRLTETTQVVSKTAYPDLNSWASGLSYPWGSDATTFNLPPAAGYFLRFAGTSSAIDPDGPRTAGSIQDEEFKEHTHTASETAEGGHFHTNPYGANGTAGFSVSGPNGVTTTAATSNTSTVPNHTHTITIANAGGDETRPKNVALHLDILASPPLVAAGLVGTVGYSYKYSSTTTAADPGAGYIRFNNTSLASATAFYISETDALGGNLAGSIATWDSSTSTIKGRLRFIKTGAPGINAEFDIAATKTDNGSWVTFSVTHRSSNGAIVDGDSIHVLFTPKGDVGAGGGGGGGGDVVGPASAVDGNFATYDGTTGKVIEDSGLNAASFEAAGAVATGVAAGIAAHVALTDPHTQYLLASEGIPIVTTRAALKALDTTTIKTVHLRLGIESGTFQWWTGDYSVLVALDSVGGFAMKADAVATTSGAWLRIVDGDRLNALWFSVDKSGATATHGAAQVAINVAANAGYKCYFPRGLYRFGAKLTHPEGSHIVGDGKAAGIFSTKYTYFWADHAGDCFGNDNNSGSRSLWGVNFYRTQPVPGGGAYTPNTYGWEYNILGGQDIYFDDIHFHNVSKGIKAAGDSGTGAVCGRIHLRRITGQPLVEGFNFTHCLDVIWGDEIEFWVFFSNNANVVAYTRQNAFGMTLGRVDNSKFGRMFFYSYFRGLMLNHQGAVGGLPTGTVSLGAFDVFGSDNTGIALLINTGVDGARLHFNHLYGACNLADPAVTTEPFVWTLGNNCDVFISDLHGQYTTNSLVAMNGTGNRVTHSFTTSIGIAYGGSGAPEFNVAAGNTLTLLSAPKTSAATVYSTTGTILLPVTQSQAGAVALAGTMANSGAYTSTYHLDTTGAAVSVAGSGTLDVPAFSGLLVINNHTTGSAGIYLCGGGSVTAVATVVSSPGTVAYNAGGYRFTNTGSTATFGFLIFRTRTTG